MPFAILTDEEFLPMVADKDAPEEFDKALLEMRREGRIQIFDDGPASRSSSSWNKQTESDRTSHCR